MGTQQTTQYLSMWLATEGSLTETSELRSLSHSYNTTTNYSPTHINRLKDDRWTSRVTIWRLRDKKIRQGRQAKTMFTLHSSTPLLQVLPCNWDEHPWNMSWHVDNTHIPMCSVTVRTCKTSTTTVKRAARRNLVSCCKH